MARAVCALDAVSRWAVTGTPIQNRLGDLATLLKFLQVYPYGDKKVFESDISYLWKNGDMEEAVKRLKRLSGCLVLRRPQGTINLPPRHDMQCPIEITAAERKLYDEVRTRVIAQIEEALADGAETTRSLTYVNVLQQIEAMRMICNLGIYYHSRHDKAVPVFLTQAGSNWGANAQKAFNLQREMGPICCHYCHSNTDEMAQNSADGLNKAQFSSCMRLVCSECVQMLSKRQMPIGCGCKSSCIMAQVSTSVAAMEDATLPRVATDTPGSMGPSQLPTKIATLVKDLNTLPPDVKWYAL